MADKIYKLIFTKTDGTEECVEFTAPQGEPGADGKDGGYYVPTVSQPDANTMRVRYAPSVEDMQAVEDVDVVLPAGPAGQRGGNFLGLKRGPTSKKGNVENTNGIPINYSYIKQLYPLLQESGATEVGVGDFLVYSYYIYPVVFVDIDENSDGMEGMVYLGARNSIRGATGATGATGPTGPAGADGKNYSFDPTVYGLPVLYLTGDISPIAESKDNKVTLDYVYGERSGTCTLKGQGATSYKIAQQLGEKGKYNYTINFDTAFEAVSGWGEQKKYCLKANWIDHSHSRNVVCAKLWGLIVKSRTTANANLSGLVNGGAVDGFPIVLMVNGEFHGLYTWNIPKDGWMFGLVEDTTKTQAVVGANDHETATQFKGELAGDESDFELEFVSDEDNAAWVTTSLNMMINACINSWGGDLDDVVAQYLDWDSVIDYYIFIVIIKGTDMVDKNYLLTTFDGTKWVFTAYDMDSTYGLNWDGSGLTRAVSNVNFEECAETHRAYELVKRFKTNALKARYAELRANVLSETRICQYFENFAWAIPSPVALEDVKRWPSIHGSSVNGIDQICRWVRQRIEATDAWINALPAQETPVEPEEPSEGYTNLVPTSTDTDGSIYNGVGYKEDVRLSSSGGVSGTAQNGSVVTGFMPYTSLGIVRIKGALWFGQSNAESITTHWYINFYDSSKAFIGSMPDSAYEGSFATVGVSVTYDEVSGVTTFDFSNAQTTSAIYNAALNAHYVRLNAKGKGADLIVTVNQEITD